MNFRTNHCALYPPANPAVKDGYGIKIPEDRDFFFRAKQYELVDQYTAARFFLRQTEGDNYKGWISPTEKENVDCGIQNTWKSYFYEAALMFYNIVVDLSWVLLYLSAEYVCYQDDRAVQFESVKSMSEAMELMRKAEGLVVEPFCNTNPIGYIKKCVLNLIRLSKLLLIFGKNIRIVLFVIYIIIASIVASPPTKKLLSSEVPRLRGLFVQMMMV